MNFINVKL